MRQHHAVQPSLSPPEVSILACLITEPKTATDWYGAAISATGQGIEPGAFSRLVARLERRGWIEALPTEHPLRLYQLTATGWLAIERAET